MTANVLIIGSGAREHALAWKLRQSPRVGDLYVAPGNAGTATVATNLALSPTNREAIATAARRHSVELVVVGPEGPLAAGLADHLSASGTAVFGPTQAAAKIESSKSFAKQLMAGASIPTGRWRSFEDYGAAAAYVRTVAHPVVVKADGLAGGKGVTVPHDLDEALEALEAAMVGGAFGSAGQMMLVEERLYGREVSAHAFSDGNVALPMPYACDHKAVFDGGLGPNTGGMGAYSPPAFVDARLHATIWGRIVEPAMRALASGGTPYRGALYPGLMLTEAGPRVIEFNCRFGDPETEVIVPRLRGDLFEPLWGAATGDLGAVQLDWREEACVGVVLAAEGYPGPVRQGDEIGGLEEIDADVLVFHAGTGRDTGGRLVTAGGRVLTVVASGVTVDAARRRAYENVPRIHFSGRHFRTDIGLEPGQDSST